MTQPRMVGDRYELGELVGYGGMAEVHRGHDTRLNRDVAIKVLRADLARDPSFLNRFRREAHSAAGLNHPAIVSVYDTGEDAAPDGTSIPFIVMEYVEGRTLRDILKAEGALPPRRAMEITADIDSALDFSHRNGIIHRDIKPANVMITQAGAVKVMDFGIARAVADTSATVTQTANVIGTAQYLSPEQARGETVDARSDVYSTGCLLYELITGVPPFQGDSPVAVAYQHVRENPVAPSVRNPDVPRPLDSIVMKALAKNQLNRYQSAGEMRADLQRALADQPVVAESVMTDAERTQFIARTPPRPMAQRPAPVDDHEDDSRRTGWLWAAVVVALLLVIGIGSFVIFGSSGSGGTKQVAITDVTGQLPDAAANALRGQGFRPVQNSTTSGGPCTNNRTVEKGQVCTTSPVVGKEVPKGSVVTYTLFSPKLVNVPFVEGKSYNDAVELLQGAMLGSTRKDVHNADPKGTVEKQGTAQFTQVPPGTKVLLEVSTGTIQLPDVRGQTLNDAQSLIPSDFTKRKTQTKTTPDPDKDGQVADESPKPKGYYAPNQQITLTVYNYVAPKPTCTTPPPAPTSVTPTSPLPGAPTTPTPGAGTTSTGLPAC